MEHKIKWNIKNKLEKKRNQQNEQSEHKEERSTICVESL